ncbi:hypothetical protein GDO86_003405 [Hymenochirus boettgeri]|uniref:Uncharacterized protein n=1 Tax=Hymenochirus boettgeri TaxID=247094 RepID=A0A8T2K3X8_9PIPI|nr:hypothetical protein GDO86_003405 [Hymenochirus boettgeri]KAG8451128.1 hypothetical protein GDO86_003405 [Hymenochirus boettgeri]
MPGEATETVPAAEQELHQPQAETDPSPKPLSGVDMQSKPNVPGPKPKMKTKVPSHKSVPVASTTASCSSSEPKLEAPVPKPKMKTKEPSPKSVAPVACTPSSSSSEPKPEAPGMMPAVLFPL